MKLHKKIILIWIFILNNTFLYGVTNISTHFPQKFKITSLPETNYVPLNKRFNVTVEIRYEGSPGEFIISEPYIEKFHNLELVSTSVENLVENISEDTNLKIIKKRYIYTLMPKSLGLAYFPKVTVAIADRKGNPIEQLEAPAVPITIGEPVYPTDYSKIYIFMIILFSIIIIGLTGLYFWKKYKLKKEAERRKLEEMEKAKIPIEDKYIKDLIQKDEQIRAPNQFYSEAAKLVKDYIEEKYQIRVKDKSTTEIINLLKTIKEISEEQLTIIKSILEESDIVKYAQGSVDISRKTEYKERIKSFLQENISKSQEVKNEQINKGA